MKAFLNASEVARLLNRDRATVSRWIKKGVIKGVQRPGNTQQWRIPFSSCEQLSSSESQSYCVAIKGWMIDRFGFGVAFWTMAVSFLVAGALLLFIRKPKNVMSH